MVPVYVAVTLLLACGGQLRSIQKTKRAVNVSKAVAGGLQLHKVNLPVFILHLLLRLASGFFKTQMESQLRFFQLLLLFPSPSLSSLFSAVVTLKTSGPHLASPLQTSSQPPLLTPPSVKTCPPLRSGPTSSPPCSTCLEQQWRTGAAHCSASWSRSRRYCWLRCTGVFTRSHDHEEQVLKRSSDSDCCGFFFVICCRPSISRDCGTLRPWTQVLVTVCLAVTGRGCCGAVSVFAAFLLHFYRVSSWCD